MRKARWAFINTGGSIVRRVAPELIAAENAELVAVCSRDMQRARAFADEYGIPDAYGCCGDMLKRDDIDIVYIGLPNFLHADYSVMCMEAGKNVVCEKPMARSAAETKRMIEAAKKNDVFLMEGLWTRFFPAYKKAMEWIGQGAIGRPLLVEADFGVRMPDEEQASKMDDAMAWRMDLFQGGGSISDLGIYCVSLAIDVMGGLPDAIHSHASRFAGGADKHNVTIFRFGKDRFAHLSSSFLTRMPTVAGVFGEEGSIELGDKFWQPDRTKLFLNKGNVFSDDPQVVFTDDYFKKAREGFKYEIEAASAYVMEGRRQAPEVSWNFSMTLSQAMDAVRSKWK
jgi:predicted dehydrogenase